MPDRLAREGTAMAFFTFLLYLLDFTAQDPNHGGGMDPNGSE